MSARKQVAARWTVPVPSTRPEGGSQVVVATALFRPTATWVWPAAAGMAATRTKAAVVARIRRRMGGLLDAREGYEARRRPDRGRRSSAPRLRAPARRRPARPAGR